MEGENFKITEKDGKMTIVIDLKGDTTLSGSGKSNVIASTRGSASIKTSVGPVSVGLNVYTKA